MTTNNAQPAVAGASAKHGSNTDADNKRLLKCATGLGFLKSLHGILDIVIFIVVIVILICADMNSSADVHDADILYPMTDIEISATQTKGAVIAFAVFGLLLILVDSILYISNWIYRLSAKFDLTFNIIMLVLAFVYLILGCIAAAWEKKMDDTLGKIGRAKHSGAAAVTSFFLFVATIVIAVNFILRLTKKAKEEDIAV
ncbi:unnamed protein product [Adineta steineri]|uniref:MARVEL domain-containing protein n=1 Tax=Adineta steineri TaxID=433720 RepID=A0A819B559_9BILA|nr:unnamed protein product [Adineta steineri]